MDVDQRELLAQPLGNLASGCQVILLLVGWMTDRLMGNEVHLLCS